MEAATIIHWRPLGEMLVDRGLLTLPQLEDALDEQERTGARLGMILVAHKIVPGAVLTTILAEQLGVELETQGGFGSGLFTKIAHPNGRGDQARRKSQTAVAAPTDLSVVSTPPRPSVDEVLAELDRVAGALDASRARCAELEAELRRIKAAARRKAVPAKTRKVSAKAKAAPTPKAAPKKPSPARAKAKPPAQAKPRATKPKPKP